MSVLVELYSRHFGHWAAAGSDETAGAEKGKGEKAASLAHLHYSRHGGVGGEGAFPREEHHGGCELQGVSLADKRQASLIF